VEVALFVFLFFCAVLFVLFVFDLCCWFFFPLSLVSLFLIAPSGFYSIYLTLACLDISTV
jgi:hypothetical protein